MGQPADETSDQSTAAPPIAEQPARAGLVLISLIAVAAVANLNLSVANVALPSIGRAFDSSQTTLDLIAVGYSLGLAASVLYLGALGDRYGRKLMLILGMALSVPACLLPMPLPTPCFLEHAYSVESPQAWPTQQHWLSSQRSGPAQGVPSRSRCGRRSAAALLRSGPSSREPCLRGSGGGRFF